MKKLLLIMGVVLLHFNSNAQCANANNIYSFTANGKRYELVRENRTWAQAASCAVARGGYLAHIESAAENTAIFNALSSSAAGITLSKTTASDGGGGSYVWLGGNDLIKEGAWIWDGDNQGTFTRFWNGASNGSSAGNAYNRWGVSSFGWQAEPDDAGGQDAMGFALSSWPVGASFTLGLAGMWNDLDASNTLYYLIEYISCSKTSSTIDTTSCNKYTSPSGKKWTKSGNYNDTIPNVAGCDSVITINLTIKPNSSSLEKISACDSLEAPNGGFWTETGTYTHTIPNAIGCDSIIIYELTVSKTSYASVYESTCNYYTSPSGKSWTTSGTYNDTIPNAAGCDSVITVNLTILSSTQSSITESVCDSYTSPSGKTWIASGVYKDTIPNVVGCDSIITVHLEVLASSRGLIDVSRCNSYTSPSGKVWTASGTYNDTIPNAAGCDSLITVNLTILSNTQSTSNVNSCSAFTSPSGKTWSTSGTYNDTVPNAAGCDSVMTFNLTIISVDNQVTKTKDTLSAAIGDAYQWLDCEDNYAVISGATNQTFVPVSDGEYAVEVTKSGCVDTSDCILVVLSSIVDINDNRVKIYPNPTTDYIQLGVQEGVLVESIKVYDMLGKEFEITYTKSQNRFKISLGELPSGNYMIVIQSQGNQIRRQVQKM